MAGGGGGFGQPENPLDTPLIGPNSDIYSGFFLSADECHTYAGHNILYALILILMYKYNV